MHCLPTGSKQQKEPAPSAGSPPNMEHVFLHGGYFDDAVILHLDVQAAQAVTHTTDSFYHRPSHTPFALFKIKTPMMVCQTGRVGPLGEYSVQAEGFQDNCFSRRSSVPFGLPLPHHHR